jgi:hypothetical protein
VRSRIKVSDDEESFTSNENTTYFIMAGSIVFETSKTSEFAITPTVIFNEGDSLFRLTISMIYPR